MFPYYTIQHKLRMGWSIIEPSPPPGQGGSNRLTHGMAD
jgi:hypothetical protein